MRLCILTYDAPHRKSQDIMMRLHAMGYHDVRVVAQPWIVSPKNHVPLVSHRPGEPLWPCPPLEGFAPSHLCKVFAWGYEPNQHANVRLGADEIGVVAGARILPKEVTDSGIILNAHPAILPYGRGLDSTKWCLLRGRPIGVTAHILDAEADMGYIVESQDVPVYPTDTMHAFFMRQYEMEIALLFKAIKDVEGKRKEDFKKLEILDDDVDTWTASKRMGHAHETMLLDAFESFKRKSYKI